MAYAAVYGGLGNTAEAGPIEAEETIYEGWVVERFPRGADGVAYDSKREPFFYGATEERFRFRPLDAAEWHEITPGINLPPGATVTVDDGGHPHTFILIDGDEGTSYKYAFWDGADWVVQGGQLAAGDGFAYDASLAVASGNRPHVLFTFGEMEVESGIEHDSLFYGSGQAGRWYFEEIASLTSPGYIEATASLALDRTGTPHVSFCFNAGYEAELKYAYRGETGWRVEVVEAGWQFTSTSLALDDEGRPCVAYCDNRRGDLKYARRETAGWAIETVDAVGWSGPGASLALDKGDIPYVAYYEDGPKFERPSFYRVKVARRSEDGWRVSPVATLKMTGLYLPEQPAVPAVDAGGRVRVLYFALTDNRSIGYCAKWVRPEWPACSEKREVRLLPYPDEPELARWAPTEDALRPKPRLLRAEPNEDSEVIIEADADAEVEVIDAVCVREIIKESVYAGEVYGTWYKARVGDKVGWGQSWQPFGEFIAEFTAPYSPLRERPSAFAPPITEEKYEIAEFNSFALRPTVPAGTILYLNAAYNGWYLVDYGGGGAWLPADTPGVDVYRRIFHWYFFDTVTFDFYVPVAGEVRKIIFENSEFLSWSRLGFEDPVLTLTTHDDEFELIPELVGGLGGYESVSYYLAARLPYAVKREDITAITYTTGVPERRLQVSVDPREAWAEYDE